jgi:hypothetical protein
MISPNPAMRALSLAAGVGIKNKRPVKNRLNDVAQGVMDYSVLERRGRNQPPFRVKDTKLFVLAELIIPVFQFFFDFQQSFFQFPFKPDDVIPAGFVLSGLMIAFQKILEIADAGIKVFVSFH